jgi:hypothetical protein
MSMFCRTLFVLFIIFSFGHWYVCSYLLLRFTGPGWLNELDRWIWQLIQAYHQYAWVRARLCKLQKGCTRLAAASYKVYHDLLVHGRWFSPGTPASSTTKTGRHDIAEILLKVALKHQKIKKSNHLRFTDSDYPFGIFKLFLLNITTQSKPNMNLTYAMRLWTKIVFLW